VPDFSPVPLAIPYPCRHSPGPGAQGRQHRQRLGREPRTTGHDNTRYLGRHQGVYLGSGSGGPVAGTALPQAA
jgi:hypothetical protein